MNVTLRQLRAFVLVGRLASFTRAAQAMHVTQSALSLLIRELENVMSTRLVDRTTRNVSLTAAGREFFASTQRILEELEHAIGNVDKLVAKERGRVVIAAPLVLSSTLLPPILAGFKAAYPGIELVLNDSLPAEVLPQVRAGTADIGIGTFAHTEEELQRDLVEPLDLVVLTLVPRFLEHVELPQVRKELLERVGLIDGREPVLFPPDETHRDRHGGETMRQIEELAEVGIRPEPGPDRAV